MTSAHKKSYTPLVGIIVALCVAFICFFLLQKVWGTPPLPKTTWEVPTSTTQNPYAYIPDPHSTLIHFSPGIDALYTNDALKFSFRIPDGFVAPDKKISGGNVYLVTLSNKKGDDLIILATPLTDIGEGMLTPEFIQANSEKGQTVSNFRKGSLREGTTGLLFDIESLQVPDGAVGFWFIRGDYLYEVTTYKKDMELLDMVMQTVHFGNPVLPPPRKNI